MRGKATSHESQTRHIIYALEYSENAAKLWFNMLFRKQDVQSCPLRNKPITQSMKVEIVPNLEVKKAEPQIMTGFCVYLAGIPACQGYSASHKNPEYVE